MDSLLTPFVHTTFKCIYFTGCINRYLYLEVDYSSLLKAMVIF